MQINTQYKPSCRSTFIHRKHNVYELWWCVFEVLEKLEAVRKKANRHIAAEMRQANGQESASFHAGGNPRKYCIRPLYSPITGRARISKQSLFSYEHIGRFSEKMLRLFKTIWPAAGFSVDHSLTAVLCCELWRRKEFGYLPNGNRGSGDFWRRTSSSDRSWTTTNWTTGSSKSTQRCGVEKRSSLRSVGPGQCSMGMELESRRTASWRSGRELEVSSFAAIRYVLLDHLDEPSLYKIAGVMRAVINLHPSPPPSTRLSLSGRILKKQWPL